MPDGAIDYLTLASSHGGVVYETIDLSASGSLLVAGTNTLAVELHQAGPKSTDLVWDCELLIGGFTPWLGSAAPGNVDPIGGVPFDVLRLNGSTGGLGRGVDMQDGADLTIDVDNPPAHSGGAGFALFAWFEVPGESDRVPLGKIGDLCFPPVWCVANNLGFGPPGALPSSPAPWTHVEPAVDGPLDLVLQGVIEETAGGRLKTTNAVWVRIR
jgi:hypothetical protein